MILADTNNIFVINRIRYCELCADKAVESIVEFITE